MSISCDRDPKILKDQVTELILIIGNIQAYPVIFNIDPMFKKFMAEEAGLDTDKLVSLAAGLTLKNADGIVTEENCKKFIDNYNLKV